MVTETQLQMLDVCQADWTVRAVGDASTAPGSVRDAIVGASVPGCVHTDLMRAGLIADPRHGFNEIDLQWIGLTDWEYRAVFHFPPDLMRHHRLDLACEGLDTIAEVSLNGQAVGSAANMFHPHRFDLRGAARIGANELSIVFRSPLRHIRAEEARLGKRPVNGDWDPYVFIRKAACNLGWDWGPRVATSGIWQPLRIEAWSGARLAEVRPLIRRSGDQWTVDAHVAVERATNEPVRIHARLSFRGAEIAATTATVPPGVAATVIRLGVDRPRLWWPRGSGEQPLYELSVSAGDGGPPLRRSIGFREVRLNTEPDEHGSRFQIEVNSRPVFCKGANWIPEGLFPADRAARTVEERVQQAAAANMNMLRVWGGGMYESGAFYDACDRLGVMVWQDFMFACACYPEEPPYRALVEAEARYQISRLSSHPSVVLWCGGNECVWAYERWGGNGEAAWKRRVGSLAWGGGYYFDLLPRLLEELDPTRPWWPNSPWSGQRSNDPNDASHGDRHTWDVRAEGYRTIVPRFCSEFGHQSPSNVETLARVLGPADLQMNSQALQHRQRGTGGMARHIDECLAEHFPTPTNFAQWHLQAQQMQARALEIAIDWLAANRPRCMGALVWQLNDAWPGMSWSLIDSDGAPKPAYFAVQRAFGRITP